MDATLFTLITGGLQALVAVLLFMGWDRKFIGDHFSQKLKGSLTRGSLIVILAFGGLLFSGLGFYRAFTVLPCVEEANSALPLTVITGRNFLNERVPLDGMEYQYCTFSHVTFVYNGGIVDFHDNTINGPIRLVTGRSTLYRTFMLLRGLDAIKADFSVLGPNLTPLQEVEPIRRVAPTPAPSPSPSPSPSQMF